MRTLRLVQAVPPTFAGSNKTGADGARKPAKWDAIDETGRKVARLARGSVGWEILHPTTFLPLPGFGLASRTKGEAFAKLTTREAK